MRTSEQNLGLRWSVEVCNRDGTVCCEIDEGPEFYEEVSAIIREKGSKGFFYAIYEGLMINLWHIQPLSLGESS